MSSLTRKNQLLSVVIPAYNEEGNIPAVIKRLSELFEREGIDFELVFVDDGSNDGSWAVLEAFAEKYPYVQALSFSRNFGKEAAIFAGLEHSTGACAVVFDCDLQFPPEAIIEMFSLWLNNDLHIIEGKKRKRQNERGLNRFFAQAYYHILKKSSGLDLTNSSDFKLLDRKVIDILSSMPERNTFFRAISGWVGFNNETVYFDVAERQRGETKWPFVKLFNLALGSITSFTSAPMHIVTIFGVAFFLFAAILTAQSFYMKLSGKADEGFTTVIILLLIIGSIIMISLGIIGVYLSKIYDEIKARPKYIIKKKIR